MRRRERGREHADVTLLLKNMVTMDGRGTESSSSEINRGEDKELHHSGGSAQRSILRVRPAEDGWAQIRPHLTPEFGS